MEYLIYHLLHHIPNNFKYAVYEDEIGVLIANCALRANNKLANETWNASVYACESYGVWTTNCKTHA